MGLLNEPDRVDSLSVPTGEGKTWELPGRCEKLIPNPRLGTARCVDLDGLVGNRFNQPYHVLLTNGGIARGPDGQTLVVNEYGIYYPRQLGITYANSSYMNPPKNISFLKASSHSRSHFILVSRLHLYPGGNASR